MDLLSAMGGAAGSLESLNLIPVGTKLVVFLTLFGVAQDFVGFADFFKFFLRFGVIGVEVRMILTRKFTVSRFDFFIIRFFRDAKEFVEVHLSTE